MQDMEAAVRVLERLAAAGPLAESVAGIDTMEVLKAVVGTCGAGADSASPAVLSSVVAVLSRLCATSAAGAARCVESGTVKRVIKVSAAPVHHHAHNPSLPSPGL